MSFEKFSEVFELLNDTAKMFFLYRKSDIGRSIAAGEDVIFTVVGNVSQSGNSKVLTIKMNESLIAYYECYLARSDAIEIHNTIDYRNGSLYLRHAVPDAPYMKYKIFSPDYDVPIYLDYPMSEEQYFQQSLLYDIVPCDAMEKVLDKCNYNPIYPSNAYSFLARCVLDDVKREMVKKYWCRVEGELISVIKN